jgi:hypothetical protein
MREIRVLSKGYCSRVKEPLHGLLVADSEKVVHVDGDGAQLNRAILQHRDDLAAHQSTYLGLCRVA